MPLFIEVCVPLIRGTLRKPALSPINAAPGITSLGTDWKPPSLMARAPYETRLPPARISAIAGWVFQRCIS